MVEARAVGMEDQRTITKMKSFRKVFPVQNDIPSLPNFSDLIDEWSANDVPSSPVLPALLGEEQFYCLSPSVQGPSRLSTYIVSVA
jgi:hypothetical protein